VDTDVPVRIAVLYPVSYNVLNVDVVLNAVVVDTLVPVAADVL
jgi:hypothetical protein